MQDFEIVVVGGNSTDGGENIVQQYSDSRIRFIREIGKGVSAARNQGVNEAYAEIVAFLINKIINSLLNSDLECSVAPIQHPEIMNIKINALNR